MCICFAIVLKVQRISILNISLALGVERFKLSKNLYTKYKLRTQRRQVLVSICHFPTLRKLQCNLTTPNDLFVYSRWEYYINHNSHFLFNIVWYYKTMTMTYINWNEHWHTWFIHWKLILLLYANNVVKTHIMLTLSLLFFFLQV